MKITESQIKALIKEEVIKALTDNEYVGEGLGAAKAKASAMVEKLDSIADEIAQERALERNSGGEFELDVEEYFEPEERQVLVNGEEMFIVGSVYYNYIFAGNYGDDTQEAESDINLSVVNEDGDEMPLDIER